MSTLPLLATAVFGLAKIIVGLSRKRPVGFLVFGCLAALVAAVVLAVKYPRVSREGKRRLERLESSHPEHAVAADGADAAWTVALLGIGAASLDTETAGVFAQRQNFDRGYFASGCGSSGDGGGGGGGDGGGGCGGCGGCGD